MRDAQRRAMKVELRGSEEEELRQDKDGDEKGRVSLEREVD